MFETGIKIAGVPLRVSPWFLVIAVLAGYRSYRTVASTPVAVAAPPTEPPPLSDPERLEAWLAALSTRLDAAAVFPEPGWVIFAGIGVGLVYVLSVFLHELGHLLAARALGVPVSVIGLHFAGGFVEFDDDDRLTAGKLAAIVAAGPAVTALLALLSGAALASAPLDEQSGAAIAVARILAAATVANLLMLGLNLLPFRSLDGGQLLAAARLRLARTR